MQGSLVKNFIIVILFFIYVQSVYSAGVTIGVDLQLDICEITYVDPSNLDIPETVSPDSLPAIDQIESASFSLQGCGGQTLMSIATSEDNDIRVFYASEDSLWLSTYSLETTEQNTESIATSEIPLYIFYLNGFAYGFFEESNQLLEFDESANAWVTPTKFAPLPSGTLSPFIYPYQDHLLVSIVDGLNRGLWKIEQDRIIKVDSDLVDPAYRLFSLNNTVYRVRNAANNLVLDDLNSYNNLQLETSFEKYASGLISLLQVDETLYKYDKSLGTLSVFTDRYTRLKEIEVPGTLIECGNFDTVLFCLFQTSRGTLLFSRIIDGVVVVDAEIDEQTSTGILESAESIRLAGLGEARFVRVVDAQRDTIYALTDTLHPIIVNKKSGVAFTLNKSEDGQSVIAAGIRSNGDIAVDYIFPKDALEELKPLSKYIEDQQASIDEQPSENAPEDKGAGASHSLWLYLLLACVSLRLRRSN